MKLVALMVVSAVLAFYQPKTYVDALRSYNGAEYSDMTPVERRKRRPLGGGKSHLVRRFLLLNILLDDS
jgi:hypothetical protein